MVVSLFTVCAVGSAVTASAAFSPTSTWKSVSKGAKITFDATAIGWDSAEKVYLYIGRYHDYGGVITTQQIPMTLKDGLWEHTFTGGWYNYQYFFFSKVASISSNGSEASANKRVNQVYDGIATDSDKTALLCVDKLSIKNNRNFIASGTAPYAVTTDEEEFSPTSSWASVSSGATITLDATKVGWNSTNNTVYLYVGRYLDYSNVKTSQRFEMTSTVTNTWTYKFTGSWDNYQYYFFSTTNTSASNKDIKTVYDAITDKTTKTELVCIDDLKISDGNVYKATGSEPYSVTGPKIIERGTGWLPVTLFNYRNNTQISNAKSTNPDTPETPSESLLVDSQNGLASSYKDDNGGLHSKYNDAVSKWFKDEFDGDGTNVTPLYQGNFWSIGSTSWYHFMKLANCANQSDTDAVAQGLVDEQLNAEGNITQLGLEMPQFSKSFMKSVNTGKDIQSIYENLKFEVNANKNDVGNTWFSYDSKKDGNRSLNSSCTKVIGIDSDGDGKYNSVRGTTSTGGSTDPGFFPFNEPGDGHKTVTNSFGARFDINFKMTKDGTLNGEDLQFNFSGDDDLWVFIDGYLALDMGGSHNMASGYINLNTSKMHSYVESGQYSGVYDGDKFNNKRDSYKEFKSLKGTAEKPNPIAELLKDTTREHTLTIFYMERGMFDSNLSFNFMLPQTDSLKIEQKIDTTTVNAGLLKETRNTADKDVHEVILKSNSKDAESNDTAEIPVVSDFKRVDADGAYALLQKGTGDITNASGVPFDNTTSDIGGAMVTTGRTTFVWEDTNTSFDGTKQSFGTGTGIVGDNGGVDLLYNQSAIFNDQFTITSQFQLIPQNDLKSFVVGEAGAN
ncbi:MAG: fibro-slime domain-containing protein, partial [Clostridia bacterium]|nr:fibro-slime domain-containing protein [Clostridia bacterium]